MSGVGFTSHLGNGDYKSKADALYESFIGKCVGVDVGNGQRGTGVLEEINFAQGYLILRPSISMGLGDYLRIEEKEPMPLPVNPSHKPLIYSLEEGYLEQEVSRHNHKVFLKERKEFPELFKEEGEEQLLFPWMNS